MPLRLELRSPFYKIVIFSMLH